ncbi:tail fiber protein [Acinetobacter phage vB_AbaP_ABW132]
MNILRSFTETVVTTPTDTFPISFEYDEKYDAVHVFLNDVAVEDLGYTVSQVNAVTLKVEPAIPEGTVRIERETDIDKMKYIFDAGALFIDQNVDADFRQIVHSQQEVRDGFIKLRGEVLPLVNGLQEALKQAQEASQAAEEAAIAAEEAAQITRSASQVVDESGLSQQEWNNGVESIADLLAIPSPKDGSRVFVKSYHAGRKLGGDNFEYNSSRSLENDGISVFNGWVRIFSVPYVTFFHGGAVGDYVTDDELAIERSLQYARNNGKQVFVAGNFAKSKPFILRSSDYVVGSRLNSRIKKITNQTSGLPDILAPEKTGVYDTYDVDALCIFLPRSGYYADNIVLRDIMFVRGTYGVDTPSSYGLYAPRHSSCETLNLKFDNVLNGFFAKNLFLNKHTNFSSVGVKNTSGNVSLVGMSIYDGEFVQTGTSNTFERFLFVNYQQGYFISNLQTSEFTCCYGEAISKSNGFDDTSIFFVSNPYELSFNQCGLESSYGTPMYITGSNPNIRSKVSITGWQSRWGANGTLTDRGLNLLTIAGSVDVTTDSASFVKGSEGFINDFAYIVDGARLINLGSQLGSEPAVVSSGAKLFDLHKSMYEGDGGLIKSTKDVGSDLNNGTEDSAGVVFKTVSGATLNIPSGASDIWGTSEYYGLNSSQGTQVLRATNLQKSYVRYRTGPSTFSAWVEK